MSNITNEELDLELFEIPVRKICGIDEAGRGPLAGPVTAAALLLPDNFPLSELKDSKKISAKKREELTRLILELALDYSIAWVWPHEIDMINIHNASLLAMKKAFEGLKKPESEKIELVLVDGKYRPEISTACRAVIKGDDKIPTISGASILAKTARDRWMVRYSWIDSRYGYEKHKGYPTKEHAANYYKFGPSAIQRMSFNVPYGDLFNK